MKKRLFTILDLGFIQSPAFCQTATEVTVQDTRPTPTTPDSYNKNLQLHFKHSGTVSLLPLSGNYASVLAIRGWQDNSGGKAHELALTDDNQLRIRSGYSPAWESWRRLLLEDENGRVGIGTLATHILWM